MSVVDLWGCGYSACCDRQEKRYAVRRNVTTLVLAASALVALTPAIAGCSNSGANQPGATISSTPGNAEGKHGPFFRSAVVSAIRR
ncbi:hypothetical protein NIIDMKKI_17610 [Mycobacterium kansasii]|uniref:Lipoprotein n=1 Tax=Mycobacterium kansasii TaxID=1768 RepID=A0A7G1IA18_MYCKA|nr:hypothetical protein NIIDMKKI_17610 [Mycobacterium kansasii]